MKLTSRPRCLLAALMLASLGCQAEAEQQDTASGEPAAAEATATTGASAMEEVYTPRVEVTADEAKRQGLPAATIVLDTGKQGLTGWKLSEKGEYFVLSGPPGGPLGLQVTRAVKAPQNEADWKRLIEARFKDREPEAGTLSEIKLNDEPQAAFTFTTDSGPGRSHHLMTLYLAPDSDACILVDYYEGGEKTSTPTPQAMLSDKAVAHIFKSLSVDFE